MRKFTLSKIKEHALAEYPKESCGLLVEVKNREVYIPCTNLSPEAGDTFMLDPEDYAAAEERGEILMIVHSHPDASAKPSEGDRVSIEETGVPWLIVSVYKDLLTDEMCADDFTITKPTGYEAPLMGRMWAPPVLDCYSLVVDYYHRELGITLPNFEVALRSGDWWEDEQNESLYIKHFDEAGFVRVDDGPKKHDMIVMEIASNAGPNHAGVYLGDETGYMLHHIYGRLSGRVPYGGYWADHTYCIVRHREVM